jgi:phosphoenolpyruvate carboxylase
MNVPTALSASGPGALAKALEALLKSARERAREDPFGNPVLSVALAITRHMDRGELSVPEIADLVEGMSGAACSDRSARLRAYVGGADTERDRQAMQRVSEDLADRSGRPHSVAEFRAAVERVRFAAVFTAHPTFSVPQDVWHALAEAASGAAELPSALAGRSHRPDRNLSLADEFERARFAVLNGRDAIDDLNRTILGIARRRWPDEWTDLIPCPVVLASWVGCDTDGRTDIAWWDTLRFRLESKRGQLERLLATVPARDCTAAVRATLEAANRACSAAGSRSRPLWAPPRLSSRFSSSPGP